MQVSVEKTSELGRKMTVNVPEDVILEKMEARFKKLARDIKLDGFRPGKVPISVVKKKYAGHVRGEVAGDLIQSTYFDALRDQELMPAGQPHIHSAESDEGLEYTAEFEVYPEFSLEPINDLQIQRLQSTVEEHDLDEMIVKLREQKKEWNTVERASQENDRVTIHFSGECEGENFTDGTVEDYPVEIGAGQMIPGFEDALVGLSVGDKKTFDVTFPDPYGNTKLAGKVAQFSIEVTKVEESALPEVDEAFVKAYGIEDGAIESFRADVKSNMQRELEQVLHNKLKTAVMDALYENIPVALPAVMVDQEIKEIMKPYEANAKRQNISLDDMDLPRDEFENQARRRVALGLILGEIIRKNEIKVDETRVRAEIEKMAASYEDSEEVVNWYYSDQSRLQEVQQMALENQTVDWIVSHANVVDEKVKFADVMHNQ